MKLILLLFIHFLLLYVGTYGRIGSQSKKEEESSITQVKYLIVKDMLLLLVLLFLPCIGL